MTEINHTHDPARRSWLASANDPETDFPLQNLPFGVMERPGSDAHGCVAIGDEVIDLVSAARAGLLTGDAAEAALLTAGGTLNPLLARGLATASTLRHQLFELLCAGGDGQSRVAAAGDSVMAPRSTVRLRLPVAVGSFTDFLCSLHHTHRMGKGNLPPAFKHLPIAYNSRATSVRVSGEAVTRPNGQFRDTDGAVRFGPEPWLDYELELGAVLAFGNELGHPFPARTAGERLWGYCLLNDWSARGIQFLEGQPLGPFLGKSLSTTLSAWIVTAEALAPFRVASVPRGADEPAVPAHLDDPRDAAAGGFDIALEALLQTSSMRADNVAPVALTRTNFRHMYWTFAQMITHHASNGCNLRTGDLIGSGTVSGPTDDSRACLAEINERGLRPIALPHGESRTWVEDGDEVMVRGRATRPGFVSIGFGDCRARIEPAVPWPS